MPGARPPLAFLAVSPVGLVVSPGAYTVYMHVCHEPICMYSIVEYSIVVYHNYIV